MVEPLSITGLAAGISSGFNVTVKLFQVAYEIEAVGEKARDLLETTNAITKTLDTAQKLLHQKQHLFSDLERTWMTDVAFHESTRALKKVAALVEDARVDQATTHGKVRFKTRIQYVIKDSPRLIESLTSLTLAGQLLAQAIGIICNRGGEPLPAQVAKELPGGDPQSPLSKQPPTYAESEFLNQHRRPIQKMTSQIINSEEPAKNLLAGGFAYDTNKLPQTSAEPFPTPSREQDNDPGPTNYTHYVPLPPIIGSTSLSPPQQANAAPRSRSQSRRDAWFEAHINRKC